MTRLFNAQTSKVEHPLHSVQFMCCPLSMSRMRSWSKPEAQIIQRQKPDGRRYGHAKTSH